MTTKKPYIGVSAVTSHSEAMEILTHVGHNALSLGTSRLVMVGSVASLKTLRGERNSLPGRCPPMERLRKIAPLHPLAYNLVHYNTKDFTDLLGQLVKITEFGGVNLDGLQLNMVWPPPIALKDYKVLFPAKDLVLQINGEALGAIGNSSTELARKLLTEYAGLVDHILLDCSRGKAKPMDGNLFFHYLQELQAHGLHKQFGIGVAGGLGPGALEAVRFLVKEFPDINIDAEGALRNQADDSLDLGKAKAYLDEAYALFRTS